MPKALKYLALLFLFGGAWTALPATLSMSGSDAPMRLQSPSPQPPEKKVVGQRDADPESGSVVGDAYANPYFGLSVPLPPGWTEGLAGPPPSDHGLYVLAALDGVKASGATMLIVAQDQFFSAKPFSNVAEMATDFRNVVAADIPDLSIDQQPASVSIGALPFLRFDYHAGGLYRVWLATELRCHVVSFNITGRDRTTVDRITDFLHAMSLAQPESQTGGSSEAEPTPPVCIKDHVTAQTTVHRVEPVLVDPIGLTVPVRIIIGADGKIQHVHVISATPAQRRAIEEALMHWEIKPLELMGHPTEVETGLTFEFKSRRP